MKNKVYLNLKELKSIINACSTQITTITRNIKESYDDEHISSKEELINRIANDYSLDANELKNKYLRRKKKNTNDSNENNEANNSDSEYMPSLSQQSDNKQPLLYKTEYDGNDYYVEMIEGGNIYDSKKNNVGIWSKGQMEININLITQLKNLEIQINDIQNTNTVKPTNIIKDTDDNFCKVIKSHSNIPNLDIQNNDTIPLILETNTTLNDSHINLKQFEIPSDDLPKKKIIKRKPQVKQ